MIKRRKNGGCRRTLLFLMRKRHEEEEWSKMRLGGRPYIPLSGLARSAVGRRSRRSHQQSQHALKYRRCGMGWGLRKKILSVGVAVKVLQERVGNCDLKICL